MIITLSNHSFDNALPSIREKVPNSLLHVKESQL